MNHPTTLVPTRRSLLAGALGVSALGSAGIAALAAPAQAQLGDPSIPTDPSVDFYLAVTGMPGSSVADGFEGQIPVRTWSWGVTATVPAGGGGGGAAGKATPEQFVFAASTDIHSPKLLTAVNTGRHVQRAVLSCARRGEGRPFVFLTLRFDDVLVAGYDITPDAVNGYPMDVAGLAFTKITYRFVPQAPDGSAGDPVTSTFDYSRNSV